MIKNTLEFDWVAQKSDYRVGQGTVTTPFEEIDFLAKEPYEARNEHPILFFPGFTDGTKGSDRITNAFAESGRFALTLSYPRSENPSFLEDPEGHKVHSAELVLSAVRSLLPHLQSVDAEGHSEGGSNASRACLSKPEEFRTLIVIASGGLIPGDTHIKIAKRALRNPQTFMRLAGQMLTHPGYSLGLAMSSSEYAWKNPAKARAEAVRIASADIRPRFPVLSEKLGIPNGALQFENDSLFPLSLVMEHTGDGNIFDIFRVYPFADATHTTPQNHPRTVAAALLEMTDELAALKAFKTA
jgi:pimeloyl-ACP methyl ester carboxylesterase